MNKFSAFAEVCGVAAILMSYSVNESIAWAVFHFVVGVIYVPYWLLKYTWIQVWLLQWVAI